MHRFARYSLALIAFASTTLAAQQGIREQPPLYQGPFTQVRGVFVTPIAGVPFSGTVMIQSQQPTTDGGVQMRHTVAQIARDSRGRIRNEMHMMVSEEFRAEPPLISVHVFDPETRLSEIYNPGTMISRQQKVPPARETAGIDRYAKTDDLGTTMLNGFEAKGTRVTRTISAQFSDTGKQVEVVDEFWYSDELHMNLLERHTDPRGGVQTVAITTLKREEPAASLFEVPAGYKIVDITPPERTATDAPPALRNSQPQ